MKRPTEDEVDKALVLISRSSANYNYFFDRLQDPEWLEPLAARGYFVRPEEPMRSGDQVRVPFWPESAYLARMAKHPEVQEAVAELCLALTTENARIHEDMAAAALALPAHLGARFVGKVDGWLRSPYKTRRLTERLAELIGTLAEAGEVGPALSLARSLFAVADRQRGEASEVLRPEAVPRIGLWEYGRALRTERPRLVKAAGMEALRLFLDLLDSALTIGKREGDEPWEDYSYVWYPTLDSSGDDDVRELLVAAVRDCAEDVGGTDASAVPEVVVLLEDRRWAVCRRLALHLLRLHPGHLPVIGARLANPPDRCVSREYELLAADCFGRIDPGLRVRRMSQVSEPSVERIKERHQAFFGEELLHEEAERIAAAHLRDELGPLVGGLDAPWRARFDSLVAELGPPPAPGTVEARPSIRTGPSSPRTLESLRGADVPSVIEYLRTWTPDESDFLGPSREGLARTLSNLVGETPGEFASRALAFMELDPTYVRALLHGLWDAARNGRVFAWPPVLELASWVLTQPREIAGRRGGPVEGQDPDWRWTRTAIARLLEAGLSKSSATIPIELKSAVVALLVKLIEDDRAEIEQKPLAADADLSFIAMNTTSGEALRASFEVLFWARRLGADFRLAQDPEVSELLDRPLLDFGPASWPKRSVYGSNLPWLMHHEPEWTWARADRLLPRGAERGRARAAVWESYLLWQPAYDFMLDALHEHYVYAVATLTDEKPSSRRQRDLEHRLIEHLCLYYGRGHLDLAEGGLLAEALTKPSRADLRRHALEFIGRSLGHSEDVSAEILQRFQAFWEWFRSRYAASTESAALGWWVVSKRFPAEWWLEATVLVLREAKSIDPLHGVLENLLSPVADHPRGVLRALELIVEGGGPDLSLWGLEDLVRPLLEALIGSDDEGTRRDAARLVNRLGHLGYTSFRHLLSGVAR